MRWKKKKAKLRTQWQKKVRRRLCAVEVAHWVSRRHCSDAPLVGNASLTALEPLGGALRKLSSYAPIRQACSDAPSVKLHLWRLKTFMPPNRLSDAGRSGHPGHPLGPKLRPPPARLSLAWLARLMACTSDSVHTCTNCLGNASCTAMVAVTA